MSDNIDGAARSALFIFMLILLCSLTSFSVTDVAAQPSGKGEAVSAMDAKKKARTSGDESLRGEKSLAGLVGVSEITVQADAGRQYIKSLADNNIFEEGPSGQIEDADLPGAIGAGRSFSRDSLAAKARIDQAKAQTGQTLSLLLPSLSLRANRGYEKSEPSVLIDDTTGDLLPESTHIRTDYTITVVQPVFNLPSFLDWRRSKMSEVASEENYRISDGDTYVSTVNAYLSLVSTRLQAEIALDFQSQLDGLLEYIEKRAGAGAASVSDMARVKARSQAVMSSRLELESAHRAAGTEFVRLTNLVPEMISIPVVEDVGISILPESFDSAVGTAMQSNPEIASLLAELEAEEIEMGSAKGRFLPRFDLEYTDTYSERAGGSETPQRDRRLMLVANWNVFSGGRDRYYYKERAARQMELRYRLDDQRRRVVHALSANYAAFELTRERIASGYQELASISTAADAMSKRMLSGNQSLLDLLDVYNQLYLARSNLVTLHVLEMNTVAQLVRLTIGAPWAETDTQMH